MIHNSTNWELVYSQLASLHLSDPIFHAANFNKAPIKLIACVLDSCYLSIQQQTNAKSISTAKLGVMIYGALSGKSSKIKLESFLPYEIKDGTNSLKESTEEALRWALKNKKMPPIIIGLIGAELN